MKRKFLNYSEWQGTADTIHLFLQIAGKIKLARCYKRPEWGHIRFFLTTTGFYSGIIPGDKSPFEILFNFRKHRVVVRNAEGVRVKIGLEDGLSVAAFYKRMNKALEKIGSPTPVNLRPQEFYETIDFNRDEKHAAYDRKAIALWHRNLLFAYHVLKKFLAPFRGKVYQPAYYFGTMDLTCVVFSGEPHPYGKQASVSEHTFDERFYECGFWPGDVHFDRPAFYGLPYPFVTGIDGQENLLKPGKAFFSPEKKEFFLTLENAFGYADPTVAATDFCSSSFEILQRLQPWERLNWITAPLGY